MSILDRLQDAPDAPGIRVEAGVHGEAEELPPRRLLELAGLASDVFCANGLQPGDRVVTLMPTGPRLVQAIFGAWHTGAVVCVMASASEGARSALSRERLAAMLEIARPRIIVADRDDHDSLGSLADTVGARLLASGDLPAHGVAGGTRAPTHAQHPAFIQFTSGTTGLPKAIVIEHGQLAMHLDVLCRNAEFTHSDTMVSWLPLHHDMGFVGGLLTPINAHCRLILIPTERFVRDPGIWLNTISAHRATLSPAPSFAYNVLSRKAVAARLHDVHLESWRFAWIGAEPIALPTIERFEATYLERGLRSGTLRPSYGMAEATLGIAIAGHGTARKSIRISRQALQHDHKACLVAPDSSGAMTLVSNGPPLEGIAVKICGERGDELGEGAQGRIFVKGASIVRHYFGSDENPQLDGWLDTGDLGFVLDGEVYVTGRLKNVIIRGGANVHAHDIEEAVVRGMPDVVRYAVAFAVPHAEDLHDEIVVGVEVTSSADDVALVAAVRRVITHDTGLQVDRVLVLAQGAIPRTTSGKVQRTEARALFRSGKLGAPA